jgi:hypothetical protein
LGASNISVTLLHEEFHTINYGFTDERLARAVDPNWKPPRDAVRRKDKIKQLLTFFLMPWRQNAEVVDLGFCELGILPFSLG